MFACRFDWLMFACRFYWLMFASRFGTPTSRQQLPVWVRSQAVVYDAFGKAVREVMMFFKHAEKTVRLFTLHNSPGGCFTNSDGLSDRNQTILLRTNNMGQWSVAWSDCPSLLMKQPPGPVFIMCHFLCTFSISSTIDVCVKPWITNKMVMQAWGSQ